MPPNDQADEFYVGYLPMPAGHKRASRVAVGLLMLAALIIGFAAAWTMDNPGPAIWDTTRTTDVAGTLRLSPVAFIQTPEGPVLLVEQGKFGARDLSDIGEGVHVMASGSFLSRGEMRMLELAAGADAITVSEGRSASTTTEQATGREIAARGEIVDSKCYLGAMKPGDGKTHAACARLCVSGGIPAMFVSDTFWAVIDPGPRQIPAANIIDAIGEPIEIRGTLVEHNGLPVIRSATVTRSTQAN